MTYNRVLLKLSGEALMGEKPYGIDPAIVQSIAEDVSKVVEKNILKMNLINLSFLMKLILLQNLVILHRKK